LTAPRIAVVIVVAVRVTAVVNVVTSTVSGAFAIYIDARSSVSIHRGTTVTVIVPASAAPIGGFAN